MQRQPIHNHPTIGRIETSVYLFAKLRLKSFEHAEVAPGGNF